MSIKTKNAGAYADVVGVFHKRAGTYEAVQGVYVKSAGVYGRVDAAPSLPLDALTPGAAYSVRRLRTAYTGPLLRVRRSSDSTEQDIGYGGDNWLDTTALLAFVGAGSGFIKTWYDQSGNARDVSQATTANQPRIVNSGVVDLLAGKPTCVFDGSSDFLFASGAFMYPAGASTAFVVYGGSGAGGGVFLGEFSSSSNSPFYYFPTRTAVPTTLSAYIRNDASTELVALPSLVLNAVNGTVRRLAWKDTGSAVDGYKDGVAGTQQAYTRAGAVSVNRFAIGARHRTTTDLYVNGPISEVIAFPSALDNTNRTLIDESEASAFPT